MSAALTASLFRSLDPDARDRLADLRARAPLAVAPAKGSQSVEDARSRVDVCPGDVYLVPPSAPLHEAEASAAEASPSSSEGGLEVDLKGGKGAAVLDPAQVARTLDAAFVRALPLRLVISNGRAGPPVTAVVEMRDGHRWKLRTGVRGLWVAASEVVEIMVDPRAVERVRARFVELAAARVRVRVELLNGRVVRAARVGPMRATWAELLDADGKAIGRPVRYGDVASIDEDGGET
jgi:hypothetical protein